MMVFCHCNYHSNEHLCSVYRTCQFWSFFIKKKKNLPRNGLSGQWERKGYQFYLIVTVICMIRKRKKIKLHTEITFFFFWPSVSLAPLCTAAKMCPIWQAVYLITEVRARGDITTWQTVLQPPRCSLISEMCTGSKHAPETRKHNVCVYI